MKPIAKTVKVRQPIDFVHVQVRLNNLNAKQSYHKIIFFFFFLSIIQLLVYLLPRFLYMFSIVVTRCSILIITPQFNTRGLMISYRDAAACQ